MTERQHRVLQVYLRFRDRHMTVAGLFWADRRIYCFLVPYFGLITLAVGLYFGPAAAAYPGLALVVLLLRDFAFYRVSAATWPITRQVFDWQRVEQLAASSPTPLPSRPA